MKLRIFATLLVMLLAAAGSELAAARGHGGGRGGGGGHGGGHSGAYGGGYRGGYGGARVAFGINLGLPLYGLGYYSPSPYYYPPTPYYYPPAAPYYYPPAAAQAPQYYPPAPTQAPQYYPPAPTQAPQRYSEQGNLQAPPAAQQAQRSLYYCTGSRAYYPDVRECAEGWQHISPQPPPG